MKLRKFINRSNTLPAKLFVSLLAVAAAIPLAMSSDTPTQASPAPITTPVVQLAEATSPSPIALRELKAPNYDITAAARERQAQLDAEQEARIAAADAAQDAIDKQNEARQDQLDAEAEAAEAAAEAAEAERDAANEAAEEDANQTASNDPLDALIG